MGVVRTIEARPHGAMGLGGHLSVSRKQPEWRPGPTRLRPPKSVHGRMGQISRRSGSYGSYIYQRSEYTYASAKSNSTSASYFSSIMSRPVNVASVRTRASDNPLQSPDPMILAVRHVHDALVRKHTMWASQSASHGITIGTVTALACAQNRLDDSRGQTQTADRVVFGVHDVQTVIGR